MHSLKDTQLELLYEKSHARRRVLLMSEPALSCQYAPGAKIRATVILFEKRPAAGDHDEGQ